LLASFFLALLLTRSSSQPNEQVGASASTLVAGETVYAISVDGRVVAIGNA
jgi:hypothetical protein